MTRTASSRLGNVSALARVVRSLPEPASDAITEKRKMVAEFCHLLGAGYSRPATTIVVVILAIGPMPAVSMTCWKIFSRWRLVAAESDAHAVVSR